MIYQIALKEFLIQGASNIDSKTETKNRKKYAIKKTQLMMKLKKIKQKTIKTEKRRIKNGKNITMPRMRQY